MDGKTMDYIKKLSKVDISDDEKGETADYFDEAQKYLNKLKEVHVDEMSLLADISDDIFREDTPEDFDNKEALLDEAHEKYGKYFSIPTVLDGDIKS